MRHVTRAATILDILGNLLITGGILFGVLSYFGAI